MKRCPQCGAEYDDYVQYCFVDGVELADAASVAPVAAPAPAPAPVPAPAPPNVHAQAHAPATAPAHPAAEGSRPSVSPPKVAPLVGLPTRTPRPAPTADAPSRPVPVWALLMVLMMLIAAFGFVSLAGALLLIGGGTDEEPPETVAAAPRPATPGPTTPVPPLQPRPTATTDVVQVEFESDPPGATIYEGDQQLCNTPCRVPQPDYAPPERTFVLKLEGYPDATYTMTDPTQVQQVKLGNGSTRPRPRGRNGGDTEDLLIRR